VVTSLATQNRPAKQRVGPVSARGRFRRGLGSRMEALKPLGCLELEIARALNLEQGACEGAPAIGVRHRDALRGGFDQP
jgi:hypothetical protein